jgi:protein-ribulosamine 3-kinase
VEGERFGHHRDNWIGANPQYNRPDTDWPRFFVEQRLLPQLRWARDRGLEAAVASGWSGSWRGCRTGWRA